MKKLATMIVVLFGVLPLCLASCNEYPRTSVMVTTPETASPNEPPGNSLGAAIESEMRGNITEIDSTHDTMTVLGQTVVVSDDTVFSNVASLDSLMVGDRVEVHGFRSGDNPIEAEHVYVVGSGELDQTNGIISNLAAGISLTVNNMNLTMDSETMIFPSGTILANGQYIEVHFQGSLAKLIELEDPLPALQNARVEGLINGYMDISMFYVGTTPVDASHASIEGGSETDLRDNVKVQVEGVMFGAVLVCSKLSIRASIRIQDNALGVSADQLTVLGKTAYRDSGTSPNDNVSDSDGVEVRGFPNGDGSITATVVIHLSNQVGVDEKILAGPISQFDETLKTLVIFGITVDASSASTTPANLWSLLVANSTTVKARGTFAGGILTANTVELESD